MPGPTHPTQIRLTDEDRLKIAVNREYYGSPSLSQAIRHAITTDFNAIPENERRRIVARLKTAAKAVRQQTYTQDEDRNR